MQTPDLSGLTTKELTDLYSTIDKDKDPYTAAQISEELSSRLINKDLPNKADALERKWGFNERILPITSAAVFLIWLVYTLVLRFLYQPDQSDFQTFAIIGITLNIAMISSLLFWAFTGKILPAVLLVLYFLFLLFGNKIF